jgi:hypothetical protein
MLTFFRVWQVNPVESRRVYRLASSQASEGLVNERRVGSTPRITVTAVDVGVSIVVSGNLTSTRFVAQEDTLMARTQVQLPLLSQQPINGEWVGSCREGLAVTRFEYTPGATQLKHIIIAIVLDLLGWRLTADDLV